MTKKTPSPTDDPCVRAAVAELKELIRRHYPTATFTVGPGEDEPGLVHLMATVDVDDPDEVVDLVIERMLELQLDEGVPVYVIPVRTPERVAAMLRAQQSVHGTPAHHRLVTGS
jgi:hypothetical protein